MDTNSLKRKKFLRLGLRAQLLLGYLVIILLTVLAVGLVASRLTEREFSVYASETGRVEAGLLATVFGEFYKQQSSWQDVQVYVSELDRSPQELIAHLVASQDSPLKNLEQVSAQELLDWGIQVLEQIPWQKTVWTLIRWVRGDQILLVDTENVIVADSGGKMLGERLSPANLNHGTSVVVDGKQVGSVVVAAGLGVFNPQESAFLRRVNSGLVMIGLVAAAAALMLGWWLTNRLTAPARALTLAARELADDNWQQQLPVRSSDEFGQMTVAFNEMAAEITHQRALRRRLVADVAHELRTPLSILRLELEAAQDGLQSPSDALAHVGEELTLLERLVDDLTLVARADTDGLALDMQPDDLGVVVGSTIKRWQPRASAQGLTLASQVQPNLPLVKLDRIRISQVLTNLLSNALRHTPAGGSIVITVALMDDGANALVNVSDTGEGIAPDRLPHLFDRFYRVDVARSRETGGSGLGLSIARQVVESHGGSIWAESEPGAGSTFHFTLPVVC